MSPDQPWPGEWLRGVLEVCVLRVLADGETYGYAIAGRLADNGLGVVRGGTLYPLLNRLELAGRVTTQWRAGDGGPGRKYYQLTDDGRHELESTAAHWARFTEVTGRIVNGHQTHQTRREVAVRNPSTEVSRT